MLAAPTALTGHEAIDLEVEVDQAALQNLEFGGQSIQISARRKVQQPEHDLDVPVDPTLGLEPLLDGARERLGEMSVREQLLGEPGESLRTIQPLDDGLVPPEPTDVRV